MFSLLVRLAWEENMKKEKNTTASREDYLEAILVLQQKKGMVRSVDVAQHLGVKNPVCVMLCQFWSKAASWLKMMTISFT